MEGLYHIWFSTKGRRLALQGELGDDLRQLLIEIAKRATIRLLEIDIAADHVHLLVAVSGIQTLSSAMHQLKGATSRYNLPQVSRAQGGHGTQLLLAEGIRLA
jgi:putative transposase